jgi:hypothetical protein
MSIAAVRPDLNRFLEIKKAAEGRLSGSVGAVASVKSSEKSSGASFLDIIKSFSSVSKSTETLSQEATRPVETVTRKKIATPEDLANVARSELARRKTGLLAVYGSAGKSTENMSDIETAIKKRNLGNLFDAVA